MKKEIILCAVLAVGCTISAQEEVVLDSVFYNNGKIEAVNVTKNLSDKIEFSYPGETLINEVYKNQLVMIKYRSGRVEKCEQSFYVPTISSQDQWEQVVLTIDEDVLKGRVKIETVKVKSMHGGVMETATRKDLEKKLRKEAAKRGCGAVYVKEMKMSRTAQPSYAIGILYK